MHKPFRDIPERLFASVMEGETGRRWNVGRRLKRESGEKFGTFIPVARKPGGWEQGPSSFCKILQKVREK